MEGKALGRGLSALIPDKNQTDKSETIAFVKVASIKGNPQQPRTNYDEARLSDLKSSIKEKGVLQPILVRKVGESYEVIAGERRLKAARSLNLEEVPVIIKNVNDQEALVIALIENIQREELNPIEEAEAFKKLTEDFSYSHEAIAQAVGKDRSTITNMLRLLKLPEEIQKSLYSGELTMGHARTLLSIDSIVEQKYLFDQALKKGLSVRELENLVKSKGKGGARREKMQKTRDYQVMALEEELQKVLGTKVRIVQSKKRGKIVIDYYSLEDLERVIRHFKR